MANEYYADLGSSNFDQQNKVQTKYLSGHTGGHHISNLVHILFAKCFFPFLPLFEEVTYNCSILCQTAATVFTFPINIMQKNIENWIQIGRSQIYLITCNCFSVSLNSKMSLFCSKYWSIIYRHSKKRNTEGNYVLSNIFRGVQYTIVHNKTPFTINCVAASHKHSYWC